MEFKWRKWNRIIHRDFGYFFFGMIIIYGLSGIAVNHLDDWNPSYSIDVHTEKVEPITDKTTFTEENAKEILKKVGVEERYRKHYFPGENTIKIFFKAGNAIIDMPSGSVQVETLNRRAIFHAVNWFHYNPNRSWTWFSDIFAGALILLAISGLFILKGKNGLVWRGTILVVAGILVPVVYLILFYF